VQQRYTHHILLGMAAILIIAVASGCARKVKNPPEQPVPVANTYVNDRAVLVHRGDDGSRRYYRDESGKLYYVDQGGAVHVLESRTRVEQGPAGLYYIIDDDDVSYYTDDRGRLFYRDSAGRELFVEESEQGRVIDPLPLMRGSQYPRIEQVRSLSTCNGEWRKCVSRCDDSSALSNKRNCLENCDYQREQCLQPY